MQLRKKEAAVVRKAIAQWRQAGVVDEPVAQRLEASIEIARMDWEKLAKYAFWVAIICVVISVASVFTDNYLMAYLTQFFVDMHWGPFLALALVAAAIYGGGLRRRARYPQRVFSNEAILFFAVLATAGAVYELGVAINPDGTDFAPLLLVSCGIYALIGFWFRSNLVWLFALFSLGGWLGAETGYESGWGSYYLGMNFPVRFALFGAVFTGVALLLERARWFAALQRTTLVMGLLYLFISLWIMSIFGNYGDMDVWESVSNTALLGWCVLFGAVACAAIYYGLRMDDAVTKGFGLTFLLLNLYTRYFEYFWNMSHKAIFFGVLALSFWGLGRWSENIWNVGRKVS